jgi:hypothetical protein
VPQSFLLRMVFTLREESCAIFKFDLMTVINKYKVLLLLLHKEKRDTHYMF